MQNETINEYIKASKAHNLFGVSRTTFWRFSKEEGFPKKRVIMGVTLYSIKELRNWLDSHIIAISA
jgi:predicted DNA-binding transcriptional regulator AlpA